MISQADLKAKDTDDLADEARTKIRNVAALFRSNSEQAKMLREASQLIRELLKRTVEEEPETDDRIVLTEQQVQEIVNDLAAIHLMLFDMDGWGEHTVPSAQFLVDSMHNLGALVLSNGPDSALTNAINNNVSSLETKLDRPLQHTGSQPPTMADLLTVLQHANYGVAELVSDNEKLRRKNARLRHLQRETRRYLGRKLAKKVGL